MTSKEMGYAERGNSEARIPDIRNQLIDQLDLLNRSIKALNDPPPWIAPLLLSAAWISVILLATGILEVESPYIAPSIITLALIGGYLELRWVMLERLARNIMENEVFKLRVIDVVYSALAVALYPLIIGIMLIIRVMSYRSGLLILLSILTLGLALAIMQKREAEILGSKLMRKKSELETLASRLAEEGPEFLST